MENFLKCSTALHFDDATALTNKVFPGYLPPKAYWLLIENSTEFEAYCDLTLFYLLTLFSIFPCILLLSHTKWTTALSCLYALAYSFPYAGGILCPKVLFLFAWYKTLSPRSHSWTTLLALLAASLALPSVTLLNVAFVLSPKHTVVFRVIFDIWKKKKFILPTLRILKQILNLMFVTSLWSSGGMRRRGSFWNFIYKYICTCLYNCVYTHTLCRERGSLTFIRCSKRCVTQKRLRTTIRMLDCSGMGTLPLKQMEEMTISNQEIMNVHQMWVLRAWYPAGQVENTIHPKLPRAISQCWLNSGLHLHWLLEIAVKSSPPQSRHRSTVVGGVYPHKCPDRAFVEKLSWQWQ